MFDIAIADTSSALRPFLDDEVPLAQIALGLLLGLLGWPLYSGVVRLAGAVVGLTLGIAGVLVANEFQPLGEWLIPLLIIASVGGLLVGIFAFRRLVHVVWLLMGASLGILALWAVRLRMADRLALETMTPAAQVALWGGVALVVGLLTVWLRRWLVIGATSVLGASLIAPHLTPLGPPLIAWWSAGTAGFIVVQAGLDRLIATGDEDELEEDEE